MYGTFKSKPTSRKIIASPNPQKTLPFLSKSAVITPPPMASIKTFTSSSTIASNNNDQTTEVWKCDYCKNAKFKSFEEAERHEEKCKKECQMQALLSCKEILQSFDSVTSINKDTNDIVMDVLMKLNNVKDVISRDTLQSTNIGRIVGKLQKCEYLPIANKAKILVKEWKAIVAEKEKAFVESTVDSSQKVTSKQCDTQHNSHQQPPQKKQKKKTSTATAPIFYRTKATNDAKPKPNATSTAKENIKPTDRQRNNAKKPLASIFTKQGNVSKFSNQSDDATLNVEVEVIEESNQLTNDTDYPINDKDMLSEHRKAEYWMERRRAAEEKKRILKNKEKIVSNKSVVSCDSKVIKGAEVASIFHRKTGISQQHSTCAATSATTPGKSIQPKGSGLSAKSPLDLTATTPADKYVDKSSKFVTKEKKRIKKVTKSLESRNIAPRFPIPNHVVGNDEEIEEKELHFLPSQAKENIVKTPKYQCGIDNVSSCSTLWDPLSSICSQDENRHPEPDSLHSYFSCILRPSPKQKDVEMMTIDDVSCPKQWCDKYAMNCVPHDVYGEKNKNVAEKLLSFVNDWKSHRQQAIVAAEIAHQKRKGTKKNKKTSRKRRYDSDDEFLSDSEDEGGLPKLFVLYGPVGSGKTSLAYAVAKKSNCIILEINTTDDRGGTSLKKALEECTQSHSSLALLKRKNNLFAEDSDLQDTDDEDESKSSLAIILIDEGK